MRAASNSVALAIGARPIAAVCVVAFAARAIVWQRTGVMFNDGPVFIGLAQLIADGQWSAALAHPFHPGYPAAIAAIHALFSLFSGEVFSGGVFPGEVFPGTSSWEAAGAAVSITSGAVATGVLFVFFRDAFGPRIAIVAGLLLALHPHAVGHSSDVQSEGLYGALFLAAVAALWWSYRKFSIGYAGVAGALAGFAYWVRPEGLGVALVGAALAGVLVATRRWPIRRAGNWAAALLLGGAAIAGPYIGALHEQSGEWTLTRKKSRALSVVVAPRAHVSAAAVAERPFLDTVVHGPNDPVHGIGAASVASFDIGGAVAELAKTFVAAMRPELAILAVIGLAVGIRRRLSRELFLALLSTAYCVLLIGLLVQAGYVSKRHTLPIAMLGLGYAAAGATVLGGWLLVATTRVLPHWDASRLANRAGLSSALGVAVILLVCVPSTFAERRGDRVAERSAAEWLAAYEPAQGAPVAAGKQRVAYYANAPFVRLPDVGHPDALGALRGAGARYLIVDQHYLDEDVALGRAAKLGMRELHRARSHGHTATVFAIEEPLAAGRHEGRSGRSS